MNTHFLPLVNWGLGTIMIAIFAVVCIIIVAVIFSLASSDKKAPNTDTTEESKHTNSNP
jgi:uncharacterized membrane protein